MIDLHAQRREAAFPDGIPIKLSDEVTIHAPAEFPIDVLDPLLSEEFDLAGLLERATSSEAEGIGAAIIEILTERPALPGQVLGLLDDTLLSLFGEEDFARLKAERLGFPSLKFLVTELAKSYGVSNLGEAFGSLENSASEGETSKATSSDGTSSTSETSGDAPDSAPATSDSVVTEPSA